MTREGTRSFSIVVGVSGGIAAYKACIVVRRLSESGHDVTVVPTRAALDMVGRTTWEALSGKPVFTEVNEGASEVAHVRYGRQADAVVVVPATANTMAKMRAGIADNLLTSTLLTATCPVFLAPAMHTEMWLNPATVENVRVLRERGVDVIEPASGRLTGKDSGVGRLPEPDDIVAHVLSSLNAAAEQEPEVAAEGPTANNRDSLSGRSLTGLTLAISAGGTREPIDPVRFLGNRSSGHFGVAIAREALSRGARVVLVESNVSRDVLELAAGAEIVSAPSAIELKDAMEEAAAEADVVIMAAAVADFRPAQVASTKQKKNGEGKRTLELVENPDILAGLAARRAKRGQLVVGFAAETGDSNGDVAEYGRAKAQRKGVDLMVINRVGTAAGFGNVDTVVLIVDGEGHTLAQGAGTKTELSGVILDAIEESRER